MKQLSITLTKDQSKEVQKWVENQKMVSRYYIIANVRALYRQAKSDPVTIDAAIVPDAVGKAIQLVLDGYQKQLDGEKGGAK